MVAVALLWRVVDVVKLSKWMCVCFLVGEMRFLICSSELVGDGENKKDQKTTSLRLIGQTL